MQHNKDTKKIEQIEKVSKSPQKITDSISDVMDKFTILPILKKCDAVKRCGFMASSIVFTLLTLPFLCVGSVAAMFKYGLNPTDIGQKDVYYELKNNEKIDWRILLLLIAKRFKFILQTSNDELSQIHKETEQITALIIDDSVLPKSGRIIEGIGYVHDHVTDTHILGYKLLVIGYWDGSSFIPLDFSLHKEPRDHNVKKAKQKFDKQRVRIEKKEKQIHEIKTKHKQLKSELSSYKAIYKNNATATVKKRLESKQRAFNRKDNKLQQERQALKKLKKKAQYLENQHEELKSNYRYCGLKKNDYKKQYKKKRDKNTPGYKRFKETAANKADSTITMIKRVVRHGFVPHYVLTDSWFFSSKLLKAVIDTGRKINLVSMATVGTAKYKVLPDDALLNPHQIITLYERKKGKNSRKYNARYIALQAEYQGIRVKIFLVRIGRHGRWRLVVTTDLTMSFTRMIEVYKIRWTIEVFFRECKQHLELGHSHSRDFDGQIADTTLSMIRYVLLSYYERIHYGMTIGGLFQKLSQASIEENLLSDITVYFMELLKFFANRAGVDFIDFYEDLLCTPEAAQIIAQFGIHQGKQVA